MSFRDRKPPDWKYWRLMDEVMGWEAAALSLDIDPPSLTPHPQAWMAAPLGHRRLFTKDSFRSALEHADFDNRFRLIEDAFVPRHGDKVSYHNRGKIALSAFAAWCAESELDVSPELATLGGASPAATEAETAPNATLDPDEKVAALFDPVGTEELQTMFPTDAEWSKWAERASRNGLSAAHVGTAMFNPYLASKWWLAKHHPKGWDRARCDRTLANNLPHRSRDSRSLLTGKLD